jgi:SAM-dependent methyltransferase
MDAPASLEWRGDRGFVIDGTVFQTVAFVAGEHGLPGAEFTVAKPRWMIERYLELIGALEPRNIFELGVLQGGSTAMLAEVTRPSRLVAIDFFPPRPKLVAYLERRGLDQTAVYGEVDQADRATLDRIVREQFGDEPLDLVIDDCSHHYAPTRASFNELFPRLRPAGAYVIEDWPWVHPPTEPAVPQGPPVVPDGAPPPPLARLVLEIALALPGMPGLIDAISVDSNSVTVTRGDLEVDPAGFDVAACATDEARAQLSPPPDDRRA